MGAVGFVLFPSLQVALAPVSLHIFCPQVYDTPPMAVKGPNGRDPSLDVYDVPPSVEKGLPPSNHHAVSSREMLGPHGLRPDGCSGFWMCLSVCTEVEAHICRTWGTKRPDSRPWLCPSLAL